MWKKYLLTFLLINSLLMTTAQPTLALSRSSRNENTVFVYDNNQKENLKLLNPQNEENSENENLTSENLKSNENIKDTPSADKKENTSIKNRENLESLSNSDNRELVSPILLSPTIRENQKLKVRGYAAPYSVVEVRMDNKPILVETNMDGSFETTFTTSRNGFTQITARIKSERKNISKVSKELLLYRENKLEKGENSSINLSEANSSLYKLEITAKQTCSPIIHIDNLEYSKAQKPVGKVYQYLALYTNLENEEVENATAYFRVKKSWIENENIDISKIRINKFENNSWNSVQTKIENKDENYIYLSSNTDTLSVFGVVGETKQAQTELEKEAPTNFPLKYTAIPIILICLIIFFISLTKIVKNHDSTHPNKYMQVGRCLT